MSRGSQTPLRRVWRVVDLLRGRLRAWRRSVPHLHGSLPPEPRARLLAGTLSAQTRSALQGTATCSFTSPQDRYAVPGDVMLALSVEVMNVADALQAAIELAAGRIPPNSQLAVEIVAARFHVTRLSDILLTVVEESPAAHDYVRALGKVQ